MGDTRLQLELVLLLVTHIEISISMVPNVGVTRKICYMSLRNKHRRTDRQTDGWTDSNGSMDDWIAGLMGCRVVLCFPLSAFAQVYHFANVYLCLGLFLGIVGFCVI